MAISDPKKGLLMSQGYFVCAYAYGYPYVPPRAKSTLRRNLRNSGTRLYDDGSTWIRRTTNALQQSKKRHPICQRAAEFHGALTNWRSAFDFRKSNADLTLSRLTCSVHNYKGLARMLQ
ncbi:hypothetical protein Dda_8880 [Drechslerella dactyloides]|uniref:Uncharacterized protein n=1 Tax=Drechslerella dactyloides TaxID=74499 RepID=A0AAD6IRT4_DREDA|nr:hypothetical protein Dda_8880 [Drechslerella dactyloides]